MTTAASTEPTTTTAKPPPKAPDVKMVPKSSGETSGDRAVPVAIVEWDRMWKPPGRQAEQTLTTTVGEPTDGRSWKVEYLPSMRMMRVTHTDKARPERSKVKLVPIERVLSWEAA